jgi:hypothetical protein
MFFRVENRLVFFLDVRDAPFLRSSRWGACAKEAKGCLKICVRRKGGSWASETSNRVHSRKAQQHTQKNNRTSTSIQKPSILPAECTGYSRVLTRGTGKCSLSSVLLS